MKRPTEHDAAHRDGTPSAAPRRIRLRVVATAIVEATPGTEPARHPIEKDVRCLRTPGGEYFMPVLGWAKWEPDASIPRELHGLFASKAATNRGKAKPGPKFQPKGAWVESSDPEEMGILAVTEVSEAISKIGAK